MRIADGERLQYLCGMILRRGDNQTSWASLRSKAAEFSADAVHGPRRTMPGERPPDAGACCAERDELKAQVEEGKAFYDDLQKQLENLRRQFVAQVEMTAQANRATARAEQQRDDARKALADAVKTMLPFAWVWNNRPSVDVTKPFNVIIDVGESGAFADIAAFVAAHSKPEMPIVTNQQDYETIKTALAHSNLDNTTCVDALSALERLRADNAD